MPQKVVLAVCQLLGFDGTKLQLRLTKPHSRVAPPLLLLSYPAYHWKTVDIRYVILSLYRRDYNGLGKSGDPKFVLGNVRLASRYSY